MFVNVARLLLGVAVEVRTGCQIHAAQRQPCLDMGGVQLHRRAHLFEGIGIFSLFHVGVGQLVMRLGILGVDLQGFLELNRG